MNAGKFDFTELPTELLCHLSEYLDPADRISLASTSRHLRNELKWEGDYSFCHQTNCAPKLTIRGEDRKLEKNIQEEKGVLIRGYDVIISQVRAPLNLHLFPYSAVSLKCHGEEAESMVYYSIEMANLLKNLKTVWTLRNCNVYAISENDSEEFEWASLAIRLSRKIVLRTADVHGLDSTLLIGSESGLLRRDKETGKPSITKFVHNDFFSEEEATTNPHPHLIKSAIINGGLYLVSNKHDLLQVAQDASGQLVKVKKWLCQVTLNKSDWERWFHYGLNHNHHVYNWSAGNWTLGRDDHFIQVAKSSSLNCEIDH